MSEITINMIYSLKSKVPAIHLPEKYSIISVNEDNGKLWEQVMDCSFEGYLPGTFRHIMVSNNYCDDERVFVMMNESGEPVASASLWNAGDKWWGRNHGNIIFVCVDKKYQGNRLGQQMVYYIINKMKEEGFEYTELSVVSDNYPAIKTYLNCGFTPLIANDEEQTIWKNIYSFFNLEEPEGCLKKNIKIESDNMIYEIKPELPHPPRPWPYQIKRFCQAIKSKKIYLFGYWYKYNLYMVDREVYIKLRPLIMKSCYNNEIILSICKGEVKNIFSDSDISPQALLIENSEGNCYLIGEPKDKRFIDGVSAYIKLECEPNCEQEKTFQLYQDNSANI